MGATVIAYWPGMTEAQFESQPGFRNDDRAWGNWMAELETETEVCDAIRKLKAEAILTYKTDGMDDEDVSWVSPQQLRDPQHNCVKRCGPDHRRRGSSWKFMNAMQTALIRWLKSLSAT
jgi:hypothetical protein